MLEESKVCRAQWDGEGGSNPERMETISWQLAERRQRVAPRGPKMTCCRTNGTLDITEAQRRDDVGGRRALPVIDRDRNGCEAAHRVQSINAKDASLRSGISGSGLAKGECERQLNEGFSVDAAVKHLENVIECGSLAGRLCEPCLQIGQPNQRFAWLKKRTSPRGAALFAPLNPPGAGLDRLDQGSEEAAAVTGGECARQSHDRRVG